MKRLSFLCLVLLLMSSGLLLAQDKEISLLVSTYGSIPNGDYGKTLGDKYRLTRRFGFDVGDKVGLAKSGYGIGVELATPMLTDGLDWIISGRYIANTTDPADAEKVFNSLLGDTMNVEYTTGYWHNFPIMTGIRYTKSISEGIAVTALIQAGINFARAASRRGTVKGIVGEDTEFKFERDFGYEFGAGLKLFRKWNLEVSYAILNTPRFEGTRKLSEQVFPRIVGRSNAILGEERSISMILVRLGYNIF
ncbi:hypothetical protein JW964_09790 [candidate division KSB1 bacterium]|nr:hypothetical protein [candidate division KSB1 bacterium]